MRPCERGHCIEIVIEPLEDFSVTALLAAHQWPPHQKTQSANTDWRLRALAYCFELNTSVLFVRMFRGLCDTVNLLPPGELVFDHRR